MIKSMFLQNSIQINKILKQYNFFFLNYYLIYKYIYMKYNIKNFYFIFKKSSLGPRISMNKKIIFCNIFLCSFFVFKNV
jgi:hypothetical protein